MKVSRAWTGLLLVSLACGGDDSGKNTNQNPQNGGDAATGNNNPGKPDAGGSSGHSDAATGGNSTDDCSPTDMGAPDTCTQAEFKPYQDCVEAACSDQYKRCYGNDWASGKFGGACGTYITCIQKCGCTDVSCIATCSPSTDCQTCLTTDTCDTSKCQEPACLGDLGQSDGGLGGTTTHTCADLMTCCNSLTDATDKADCNSAVSGAAQVAMQSMGAYTADSFCSSSYQAFALSGQCK